jgi:hypothetical protein
VPRILERPKKNLGQSDSDWRQLNVGHKSLTISSIDHPLIRRPTYVAKAVSIEPAHPVAALTDTSRWAPVDRDPCYFFRPDHAYVSTILDTNVNLNIL